MTIRRRARLDPRQVRDLRGAGGLALGGGLGGVVLLVLFLLLGGNPSDVPLDDLAGRQIQPGQGNLSECQTGEDARRRDDCRIVGYVNSIQAYWGEALPGYRLATTTFFDGSVSTGCGAATSEVGPFYCPADRNVYIDLGFFEELETRFGAEGGPFAEAYVIAHEYGHHVQDLLGLLGPGSGGTGPESRSVRIELQADCLAGVWAANAVETGFLQPISDEQVSQAVDAAKAVGDDRIQEETTGQVDPHVWTHGSSMQRAEWFHNGMQAADRDGCDTFGAEL
jgi:uncharacterized protein